LELCYATNDPRQRKLMLTLLANVIPDDENLELPLEPIAAPDWRF
jgi:hypothetical protein